MSHEKVKKLKISKDFSKVVTMLAANNVTDLNGGLIWREIIYPSFDCFVHNLYCGYVQPYNHAEKCFIEWFLYELEKFPTLENTNHIQLYEHLNGCINNDNGKYDFTDDEIAQRFLAYAKERYLYGIAHKNDKYALKHQNCYISKRKKRGLARTYYYREAKVFNLFEVESIKKQYSDEIFDVVVLN